jgi:hypothetical protein
MLLISVQEVSKQLAWEARNAGYRSAVTKSGGDEVLKGIEALLRHDMFFYATTDLPARLRTIGSLFGIFIRRMILVMMDANHISERLSSLKNEMSELRVMNALYCNRRGYTTLEKPASALRRRRLVEIRLELADLMKRCV